MQKCQVSNYDPINPLRTFNKIKKGFDLVLDNLSIFTMVNQC